MIAKFITGSSLGIWVSPPDVCLITRPQDPYKWAFLPEKRYLFQKHLSKHCIRAYREIYTGVGEAFEAITTDTSKSEAHPSATILEAPSEKTSDPEIAKKPVTSFTAKIDELTSQNIILMTELEQWRLVASKAETLNRELGASLEAAQLGANALQQENERIKETCRRNTLAANFFRAKAVQSDAVIKEISNALESAKVKFPVVCPDP